MSTTKTIDDVRRALHAAYGEAHLNPDATWKRGDGAVTVHYPAYLDDFQPPPLEEFMMPEYIIIWSYLLGPHRQHHVYYAPQVNKTKDDQWYGPDVFTLALEMIEGWVQQMRAERADDQQTPERP